MDLNSYLGVHAAALTLRERRTELLANNLANADTPNFKARDLDFQGALAAVGTAAAGQAAAATPGKIALSAPNSAGVLAGIPNIAAGTTSPLRSSGAIGSTEAFLKYRTPLAPSLDGNTVDPQLEQAAFAENTVHYQATLAFLSQRFKSLMTAITGQ